MFSVLFGGASAVAANAVSEDGGTISDAIGAFFQNHYDTALVFVRVTPALALRAVAIAVPLGIAAGLVASWALLRRDIVALLRR